MNEEIYELLLKQLHVENILPKAGVIVSSSLMSKRINENNELLEDLTIEEISNIENKLTIYYDFLLNNIQIGKLNKETKQKIYEMLIGKEVIQIEDMSYEEKTSIYTARYILDLKQDEKRVFKQIENETSSS